MKLRANTKKLKSHQDSNVQNKAIDLIKEDRLARQKEQKH